MFTSGAGIQSGDWRGLTVWKYQWTWWNGCQLRPRRQTKHYQWI